MASIIATSIDLTKIPKDKIIDGKKGKYLPITITLDAKTEKVYLGNVKVVWTNDNNVAVAPRQDQPVVQAAPAAAAAPADDLPF